MTKVNYFQVTGTQSGVGVEDIRYARSKKEALELSEASGIVASGIDSVTEINFKADLVTKKDAKELMEIRVRDKALWKTNTTTKAIKAKASKAKKDN